VRTIRLEDILAKKRKRQERAKVSYAAERETWVNRCADLMTQIYDWLKPLEERKYLQVHRRKRQIREDQFGEYEVDGLLIVFVDGQTVDIQPIGRYIVGAEGRVDLQAGTTTVMIVHKGNGQWEFAKRAGRYGPPKTWPFNQSTLEEQLADLVEED
jgi:hypothetical protein